MHARETALRRLNLTDVLCHITKYLLISHVWHRSSQFHNKHSSWEALLYLWWSTLQPHSFDLCPVRIARYGYQEVWSTYVLQYFINLLHWLTHILLFTIIGQSNNKQSAGTHYSCPIFNTTLLPQQLLQSTIFQHLELPLMFSTVGEVFCFSLPNWSPMSCWTNLPDCRIQRNRISNWKKYHKQNMVEVILLNLAAAPSQNLGSWYHPSHLFVKV